MPELPEVETIVRNLRSKIVGLKIDSFRLRFSKILRNKNEHLLRALGGKKIKDIQRRGKMILIHCQADLSLLFHLKMTGNLLYCSKNLSPDKHTHLIILFQNKKEELRFRDVRKFGFVVCRKTSDIYCAEELKNLGPEPLGIDFSSFKKLFERRKARIKSLLLDQNFMAGIGNIYADEIFFQARIHPLTAASLLPRQDLKRLWESMRNVLREAIKRRGSSIRDYTDLEGTPGSFQDYHRVYGRESQPCQICGEKIERIRISGRSSFFCPNCQKVSRRRRLQRNKIKRKNSE